MNGDTRQRRRHSSPSTKRHHALYLMLFFSLFSYESTAFIVPHHPNSFAGLHHTLLGHLQHQRCQNKELLVTASPSDIQSAQSHDDDDNDQKDADINSTKNCPIKTGDRNGLIRHEILADDGHPLRLYSRSSSHSSSSSSPNNKKSTRTVLLLHGRTWSSQPVFDLRTSPTDERMQSLLQTLNKIGFQAYALDFRGFGETPRDNTGYVTPQRCVDDVYHAISWIQTQNDVDKTELLGWSQGALIAQLYAQSQHGPTTLSSLTLYGTIYNPRTIYPRRPLYENIKDAPQTLNTEDAALEDFTLPGSICDEAASSFSTLALTSDTIKAEWNELHEFNVCNPALVHVPTHVISGQCDPYVCWEALKELFDRVGTNDKVWTVLPDCDHAAHILQKRRMFVRAIVGFWRRLDLDFD